MTKCAPLLKRLIAGVLAGTLAFAGGITPARAQGLSLVRDAEVETSIRALATPLFEAAGLRPEAVRIILVSDRRLNAFVAGGQNLFLNTGLIVRAETVGQVLGVVAHETGHISGGHLAKLPGAVREAVIGSIIESALAMGAMIAAGAQRSRESSVPNANTGTPPARGGGRQSAAMRNLFSFTRTQETSADAAGVALLDQTRQSSRGFLEFMEILANQEYLAVERQDPYARTHPLSRERVEFLRNHVATSRFTDVPFAPEFVAAHARMKAKLIGFLEPQATVFQRYPITDTSLEARYAHAIAYYRVPDIKQAVRVIDGLLAENPKDPFFWELKGQMLFENGRPLEAREPYEKAVDFSRGIPILKIDLAQVLLAVAETPGADVGGADAVKRAQALLTDAQRFEPESPKLWRMLAVIYGRENNLGLAALATAELALLEGRPRDARDQARRALRLIPAGAPGQLRAQDLENQALQELERLRE
jgi:predicted Zn-dependent protease